MLQAIEVIVEPGGTIRPLDELHVTVPTRAVLTLLAPATTPLDEPEPGNGVAILTLLKTPRFAQRPLADAAEVEQRIKDLRNDWDNE
jgi:hypothetical protein